VPPSSRPLAVAHRAGNSPAALSAAAALGADLAEADVHLWNGRLEVRHGRPIGRLPLLRDGWRIRSARNQLLLTDLLHALPEPGPTLMLDLKRADRATGERLRATLLEHAPGRPVLVCVAQWAAVQPLADLDWVQPVLSAGDPGQLGRLLGQLRPDRRVHAVSVAHRLLTPELAGRLHDQVPLVLAWTVNRPAELSRLLALPGPGALGVISDSAAVLRRVLDQA
jgi:hypothetical protein